VRALCELYGSRRPIPGSRADERFEASASAWMDVVDACASAEDALKGEDAWELALGLFGGERHSEDKAPGAVELQGWIELLWEDSPHVIVAGFNDGRVPEAVSGDPFLPDALRAQLGLRTNRSRLARDAYLLQALVKCREGGGRLDLLLGKTSAAGDPLRPSRLLFLCPDEELPGRVKALFREPAPAAPGPPWTRAWRLVPPVPGSLAPPKRLGVTALRRWLACPFRFYLSEVLGMAAVDPAKAELDAADFGTLCHSALEAMGREAGLADCADPRVLRDFLLAELDRQVGRRFGPELPVPLIVQIESARQRLGRVAEAQAAECAAGWRIEAVERKLKLAIAGVEIVAKIDRIDRHRDTGAVRVLDYKTADAARDPEQAHLRPRRADESPPDWALCRVAGSQSGRRRSGNPTRIWADLQLPLYRHALAAEFPELGLCGYFNLPKAAGAGGFAWWDPYPPELQESALCCAEGVCGAIAAGRFWPPNERIRPEGDDFAELFHRGAAASVDWRGAAQ
ncbi:MAG: PD-(D/E)XK nuclease family protein, partial [Opitutaceae bacterium]